MATTLEPPSASLTIYSGRGESLIRALIDDLEQKTRPRGGHVVDAGTWDALRGGPRFGATWE